MCHPRFRQAVSNVAMIIVWGNSWPSQLLASKLTVDSRHRSTSSKPPPSKDNHHLSNLNASSTSRPSFSMISASCSTFTTTLGFDKHVNTSYQMGYSLDRFKSEVDGSHPGYQYLSANKSMPAYTCRMTSILGDFDAVYDKK
jgi:hypothetical protein